MKLSQTVIRTIHRPLLTSEVRRTGISRTPRDGRNGLRLIYSGVWTSDDVTQDVECPRFGADDPDWLELRTRAAALQRLFPDARPGRRTGAYLRGLPVSTDTSLLQISRRAGTGLIRRPGIDTLRTKHHGDHPTAGILVQPTAFLIVELTRILQPVDIVYLLDAVMGPWHGPPEATKAEIRAFADALGNFRGRRNLLTALETAREKVGSPRETRLRLALEKAGLPTPVVGHPVTIPGFGTIHPDLAYPGIKLAIEYEGGHHFLDADQIEHDMQRYFYLTKAGWLVIRVSKYTALSWVLAEVREHIATKALPLY